MHVIHNQRIVERKQTGGGLLGLKSGGMSSSRVYSVDDTSSLSLLGMGKWLVHVPQIVSLPRSFQSLNNHTYPRTHAGSDGGHISQDLRSRHVANLTLYWIVGNMDIFVDFDTQPKAWR